MTDTNDASALFAPIWRRKWLILAVGVLVGVGTYLYYRHHKPSYEATTQIYLSAGAEEQITASGNLTPTGHKGGLEGAAQAALINSPIIKLPVRADLRKRPKTPPVRAALKGKAKAKAAEKSEFLTITSEARNKKGAELLVNVTAETYVGRQNARYRRAIEGAIAIARREIRRLDASQEAAATAGSTTGTSNGGKTSQTPSAKGKATTTTDALQIASLSSKLNQLENNADIQSVRQVAPATSKVISASPKRNAIFGFLVGVLLASVLAYVLSRLDPRLRTLAQIESAYGAEIVTALPATHRPIVITADSRPRPSKLLLEPLGRLQTSLQVAVVGRGNGQPARPRTVLVTSASSGDGKSTVVAGLALTEREAGSSVAVVEADLRRPTLAPLLGVGDRPGLADVLEGRLSLGEAVQTSASPSVVESPAAAAAAATTGLAVHAPTGSLSVLVGTPVQNPSGLVASSAMLDTLQLLSSSHDQVLIDAPPPLEVGDTIPLLSLVDAVVVVARVGQTSEAAARRLVQLLKRTADVPVLGVVANGVSDRDSRRYGFSTYGQQGWRSRFGLR